MRMTALFQVLALVIASAGAAHATVNADSAANYSSGWASGSNGGGGFGPWSIFSTAGAGGASNGIWSSASADLNMGNAFGFTALGEGSSIYLERPFAQAMAAGDVFTLDLGFNYDSGSGGEKGFVLLTADNREIARVAQTGTPAITCNGVEALTNYGVGTMHWTCTQKSATQMVVYATGRGGSDTYTAVLNLAQASYAASVQFYATAMTNDLYSSLRGAYFDNLVLSQGVGTNTFTYLIETNRAIVTGIAATASGAVIVPATLGGYTVTEIGRSAFKERTNITSVSFASDAALTNIGPCAFQGCTSLMLVVLPSGLKAIPDGMFYGCSALVSVSIPAAVTTIGAQAFAGCHSLGSLAVPSGLISVEESALLNCRKLTGLELPASLTFIPGQLCYECRSLGAVTFGPAVTNVGYSAFFNCLGLKSAIFPSGLASIGPGAFQGCDGLQWIRTSGTVSLGDRTFYGCAALQNAWFDGEVSSLGLSVFGDCSMLARLYFSGFIPSLSVDNGAEMFLGSAVPSIHSLGSGWSATFCGVPVTTWEPEICRAGFSNDAFGFRVDWASGRAVRVQACTNLFDPVWINLSTNTIVGGNCQFSDDSATVSGRRFYRIVTAE